jgi:hypothetical protein
MYPSQISGQSVQWEPNRYMQTDGWTGGYPEAQKKKPHFSDPCESPYKLRIVESDS